MASTQSGYFSKLRQSTVGRPFMQGVLETAGYEFNKGVNQGFLGLKGKSIAQVGYGKVFGRFLLGPGLLAFSAYQGFKDSGVTGALGEVGMSAGIWGTARAGFSLMSNPAFLGAAAIGGAAYGGYAFGERAIQARRSSRSIEMGAETIDRFGTMATIRQRSLRALQNSHINGRVALGNEAVLLHGRTLR